MPTAVIDSSSPGNARTLSTWAEVYQVMGSLSTCALSYPNCCQCYSFIARAARWSMSGTYQARAHVWKP